MFSSDADLFFESPRVQRQVPGRFGVLYLLRRDIDVCMGIDPNSGRFSASGRAEWPGAMGILAGIDLLAKFFAGSDTFGKVGDRFRGFIDRFFATTTSSDQEVIYQLRNALLHSFGWYSKTPAGIEYRFVLAGTGTPPLVSHVTTASPDYYIIDLRTLHRDFEKAIDAYRIALDNDANLQSKFTAMFPNYGETYIG